MRRGDVSLSLLDIVCFQREFNKQVQIYLISS